MIYHTSMNEILLINDLQRSQLEMMAGLPLIRLTKDILPNNSVRSRNFTVNKQSLNSYRILL